MRFEPQTIHPRARSEGPALAVVSMASTRYGRDPEDR
jgi:hypothetical protein